MSKETPLVEAVKNAIQADKLDAVLKAAGAREVAANAREVLREVAAAEAIRNPHAPLAAPRLEAKILTAARAAVDGSALGRLNVDGLGARVANQIGAIAAAAAEVARVEARAVCHSCVAIGAARVAGQAALALEAPEKAN
jgi:hypothetical protein